MPCWLAGHRWRLVAVERYLDTSWGCGGVPQTLVLRRCQHCGHTRTRTIDGHWTLEQLRG